MRTWSLDNNATIFSRTGLPLSLAWSLTIHKSQGLTIPKAVVDIGPREMSAGLSFVALSRVRRLQDIILVQFDQPRLLGLSRNQCLLRSIQEEERLHLL
jgi:ATP-dependent DNA helicase PIF1